MKELAITAPNAAPYFQDIGLAIIPGAAFLLEDAALEEAAALDELTDEIEDAIDDTLEETEEAATAPVETKFVLVETEDVELEAMLFNIIECVVWERFSLIRLLAIEN